MDKMMKVKRVRILSVYSSSEVDRSVGVSALSDAGHVTEAARRAKETLNMAFLMSAKHHHYKERLYHLHVCTT
jgi:hypothetical protein